MNPQLCDTGAMLCPLSYQATWIDGQFFYIIIFIYIYIHYHWVYDELSIHHLSMWLGSSVDRALHQYRKVVGSNPVQA